MSNLRIRIDRDRCDGCGKCVTICSEEVLAMRNGKAQLMDEDYCDGSGECLPVCPTGALTLEARPRTCRD